MQKQYQYQDDEGLFAHGQNHRNVRHYIIKACKIGRLGVWLSARIFCTKILDAGGVWFKDYRPIRNSG